MNIVKIFDNGYDFCDEGYYGLYSENTKHNNLFDYVSKDISQLPDLLGKYVAKKMNIKTFELNDYQYCNDDSVEMENILTPLHPYYIYEKRSVFIKVIGEYFNALLVRSFLDKEDTFHLSLYEQKWYLERFKAITAFFLRISDKYPVAFYSKYLEMIGADVDDSIEEVLISSPSMIVAEGFRNELKTQETIKQMLVWLLDSSTPVVGKLPVNKRLWIYGNIFRRSLYDMKVTQRLSFMELPTFKAGEDRSQEAKRVNEIYNISVEINTLFTTQEDLTPKAVDFLNLAVDYAEKANLNISEEYEIDDLYQLLYLEILSMIKAGVEIKRCKNCGMYYIVTDRKIEYCDRVAVGESKPCSMIGSKRTFAKRMANDYPLSIYNRAYKTHHARIRSGSMTNTSFALWSKEARENLDKVRSGEMDVTTFQEWLKI